MVTKGLSRAQGKAGAHSAEGRVGSTFATPIGAQPVVTTHEKRRRITALGDSTAATTGHREAAHLTATSHSETTRRTDEGVGSRRRMGTAPKEDEAFATNEKVETVAHAAPTDSRARGYAVRIPVSVVSDTSEARLTTQDWTATARSHTTRGYSEAAGQTGRTTALAFAVLPTTAT